MSPISYYFLNTAARNFKITYVTHNIFLFCFRVMDKFHILGC